MKPRYLIPSLLALVASTALQAQTTDSSLPPQSNYGQHGHWHRHHHAWIWKKLNLTDAQKQDLKQYRANHKTPSRSALASYPSARQSLQAAIENSSSTQPAT